MLSNRGNGAATEKTVARLGLAFLPDTVSDSEPWRQLPPHADFLEFYVNWGRQLLSKTKSTETRNKGEYKSELSDPNSTGQTHCCAAW